MSELAVPNPEPREGGQQDAAPLPVEVAGDEHAGHHQRREQADGHQPRDGGRRVRALRRRSHGDEPAHADDGGGHAPPLPPTERAAGVPGRQEQGEHDRAGHDRLDQHEPAAADGHGLEGEAADAHGHPEEPGAAPEQAQHEPRVHGRVRVLRRGGPVLQRQAGADEHGSDDGEDRRHVRPYTAGGSTWVPWRTACRASPNRVVS
jgi:hypothetical protein